MDDETIRWCATKTGKSWGNFECLMDILETPDDVREQVRERLEMPGSYTAQSDEDDRREEPPLSCNYISYAQAKLRRIKEWAERHEHIQAIIWASEAWDDIDKVRKINKALRKAAYGRATVHTDMTDEAWFAETDRDWATLEELTARTEVET